MRSFRSLSGDTGMLGWLWVTALVIVLDQLTKWMAEAYLEFAQPVAIFPHLNMTLAYNYGAAFSFLGDQGGWQRWFFAYFSRRSVCGYRQLVT
jgi:Lipoprotein signal peptidase